MRSPEQDKERVKHILEAIENILNFTDGHTYEEFMSNVMLRHAVFHNFVIIGEAANLLTQEYREANLSVNWGEIIGMRNFLVHGYYTVQNHIIWQTINEDLVPLKEELTNKP
ncbi:MAG: DUF86 domain-containing protein [Dysgonamonadaceae bacterium]|jgi:uncharacterized protein with HEPN domain|nr:DUF86 domain-containing protein [Dysgonamonadaceae bacterium]